MSTLLTASAVAQQPQVPVVPVVPDAQVTVRSGRAVAIEEGDGERRLRPHEQATLVGATHLEVGAGSEVRVAWYGHASMSIWGPASLQWSAGAKGLDIALYEVSWIDVESRKGEHVLHMPGDWHAELGHGAMQLRGLPSGPIELRLHAGRAITVTWDGQANQARPPIAVYAGSSVRLDQPQSGPVDLSGRSAAWEENQWPYRRNTDRPDGASEREEIERKTQEQSPWTQPTEVEPTKAQVGITSPEPAVEIEVLPTPVPRQPEVVAQEPVRSQRRLITQVPLAVTRPVAPPRPLQEPEVKPQPVERPLPRPEPLPVPAPKPEPSEPQPAPAPQPEPEPAPAPQPKPAPAPASEPQPEPSPAPVLPKYDPAQWRGLLQFQLNPCGDVAVENGKGIEVRVFANGRCKVLVDSKRREGAWVLTPNQDYFLRPGSVAVFEPDGNTQMTFGRIDEKAVPKGRPNLSRLIKQ